MEIKSVAVENFRSHEKFELALDKVTILTGPNGSGKSSILEAVATVLIGTNTWTERDGIKLPQLIRKGQKKATVSITGKSTISRVIAGSGSKILLNGDQPLTQFELLSNLKVNEQQVKAALVPQAFLTLPSKEQKDALFALLDPRLSLKDVEKYIPQEAMETWKKLAGRWVEDHPDEEFVNLDKLYAFCYEARKGYKSKAKVQPADPERETLARELGELGLKIGNANGSNGQRKAAAVEVQKLHSTEDEIRKLKDQLDDTAEAKWKDAQADEMKYGTAVGVAEAALDQAKEDLARVDAKTGKNKKVVCPISLDCPHDESAVKARQTMLKGQVMAKEGELKGAKAKKKEATERTGIAASAWTKVIDARRKILELEAWVKKTGELVTMLDSTEEVDVAPLIARKAEIERKLGAADTRPAPEPDRTVERLNAIVEALDVGGIKIQLVKKGIDALEEEANQSLSRFGSYRIRFFIESEFRPTIILKGVESSVGELSEGERLITSLVLQDVFAQRSGVNLVVIDNVDLLDQVAYQKFVAVALALKSKVLAGLANVAHAGIGGQKGVQVVSLSPSPEPERSEERRGPPGKRPIADIL